MKKKLVYALAITIITTLSATGCTGGNVSNPVGEAVASEDATADAQTIEMAPPVYFVSWEEAGLEDHVMEWQDEKLEAAIREITGITDRDIMLSDVWEITSLDLSWRELTNVDAI